MFVIFVLSHCGFILQRLALNILSVLLVFYISRFSLSRFKFFKKISASLYFSASSSSFICHKF